jgi:hypothetical protein
VALRRSSPAQIDHNPCVRGALCDHANIGLSLRASDPALFAHLLPPRFDRGRCTPRPARSSSPPTQVAAKALALRPAVPSTGSTSFEGIRSEITLQRAATRERCIALLGRALVVCHDRCPRRRMSSQPSRLCAFESPASASGSRRASPTRLGVSRALSSHALAAPANPEHERQHLGDGGIIVGGNRAADFDLLGKTAR